MSDPFQVPALGPGAPTLAKHLAAVLMLLQAKNVALEDQDRATIKGAIGALAAIPTLPPQTEAIRGAPMMRNERGGFDPVETIQEAVKLEDDLVRVIVEGALAINASIARFKGLSFVEGDAFLSVLLQDYNIQRAGPAGNVTLHTYDRGYRVKFSVQERITFTAGVKVAQELFNRFLDQRDSDPLLRSLIADVFALDDQNKLRVSEVLRLRRKVIDDPMWRDAMQALNEAMIDAGSTRYMRVYKRGDGPGGYQAITLDLASAPLLTPGSN